MVEVTVFKQLLKTAAVFTATLFIAALTATLLLILGPYLPEFVKQLLTLLLAIVAAYIHLSLGLLKVAYGNLERGAWKPWNVF